MKTSADSSDRYLKIEDLCSTFMKSSTNLIIIGFMASLLSFCSSEDPEFEEPKIFQIPKLSLNDASSLIVYNPDNFTGGRIAQEGPNLYKLKTDGSIEQVKYLNKDGTDIDPEITQTKILVSDLVKVNQDYIILNGSFTVWDTLGNSVAYNTLLVNKTTGAIYDFENYDISQDNKDYFEVKNFQYDANKNIYYLNNGLGITKLDISDPDKISRVQYLPTGQMAAYYVIDNDANCMYSNSTVDVASTFRIKKHNGGIYEFSDKVQEFWKGINGSIYYVSYNQTKEVPNIFKVTIDVNGNVTNNQVWEAPAFGTHSGVQNLRHNYYYRVPKENSVLFVAFANGSHFEFFENDNTVVKFELPPISDEGIVYSNKYFYHSNGTKLYKISLTDYSSQNLLTPGEYDIYTMDVDDNDILQISALRLGDGKKVIAEINASNVFKIIDEETNQEAQYLKRLD